VRPAGLAENQQAGDHDQRGSQTVNAERGALHDEEATAAAVGPVRQTNTGG
jgi:hypothetical protein